MIVGSEQGIKKLMGEDGRPSGEALVVMESHEDVVKALNHDRQHMGSRYVEVLEISQQQYQDDLSHQPGAVSLILLPRITGNYLVHTSMIYTPSCLDSEEIFTLPMWWMYLHMNNSINEWPKCFSIHMYVT